MSRTPSRPGLVTWFSTATATLAFDLWTFTFQSGLVVRWTNADQPLADDAGNVYALGPVINRSTITWQRGVQTDTLSATLAGDATVQVGGVPLAQFAAQGGFTGAGVTILRVFLHPATLASQGTLVWFVGAVADVDSDRYKVDLQVKDLMAGLSLQMPRNLFQGPCTNTLFDAVCMLPKASYGVALSASAVDAAGGYLQARYTGKPTNYFALGQLQFTSGKNAGFSRTVKYHATYADHMDFVLSRPFPFPLELNATFVAWPGCDKTMATCSGTFGNLPSFRGEPFIPDATTVT